jgi:hypothetical protein
MWPKWALRFPICILAFPVWILGAACGGSTAPTAPSVVELSPGSVTIAVAGSVRDAQSNAGIAGAEVQVASGPDLGKSTMTDASGNYSLTGVKVGFFMVRFTHGGFEIVERSVSAIQNTRLDVQLRRGASCKAPPAATNLRATVSGTRVSFIWNAAPSATSYLLVVGTSAGGSDALSFATSLTSYQWRGSGVKGTHYARVFARTDCAHDTPSNEVTFTVS